MLISWIKSTRETMYWLTEPSLYLSLDGKTEFPIFLFPRLLNSCWHSFDSHNHPELRGVWIFELFFRIHFSALNKCSAHRTWALGKPWTSGNCGHCFLGTWVWPFVEERLTWVLSILFLNSVSSRKWFSLLSLWKMRIVRGLTPFICMRRQWEDVYKLPGTVPISVQ